MKDWKTWVLLLGIYFLVKMCGGCEGCSGCSGVPKPDKAELIQKIARQQGVQPYEITIEELELAVKDPPIYDLKIKSHGFHMTGQVSVYNDGSIKNVVFY